MEMQQTYNTQDMDRKEVGSQEINSEYVKPRRVGTITMGIVLIITGGLLLYSLWGDNVDFTMVIKFAPVILVALGIEILLQTTFAHDRKIKYDLLSIFLCGILIFGSLGLAVAAPLFEYFSPERQARQITLQKEFEQEVGNRLSQLSIVEDVYTSIGINLTVPDSITLDTLDKYCNYATIHVSLMSYPKSKEEFAQWADQVRKALLDLPINNIDIIISSAEKDIRKPGEVYQYEIRLNSTYSKNKTMEQIVSIIDEYVSKEDYQY